MVVLDSAHYTAAVFDMDGVLTEATRSRAVCWKELFDGYLRRRAKGSMPPGADVRPFDADDVEDLLAQLRTAGIAMALPITIAYRGQHRDLSPGDRYEFRLLTPKERARAEPSVGEAERAPRAQRVLRDGGAGAGEDPDAAGR